MAQLVKNLPAMQATPVLFLGQEDPLDTQVLASAHLAHHSRQEEAVPAPSQDSLGVPP